jgi:hypothetical protein
VLESENEMNATKIISVGISVAGGGALEVRFLSSAALFPAYMLSLPVCCCAPSSLLDRTAWSWREYMHATGR